MNKRRVFLGLGSNLGDRRHNLRSALEVLQEGGDVLAYSNVYETSPLGGPKDQGAYLNMVVGLSSDMSPRDLLMLCFDLEIKAKRVRTVRFGPRTLDADVLYIEGTEVSELDLKVPHPRMYERRFVLAPLQEIAPDLVDPDDLEKSFGEVKSMGTLFLSA